MEFTNQEEQTILQPIKNKKAKLSGSLLWLGLSESSEFRQQDTSTLYKEVILNESQFTVGSKDLHLSTSSNTTTTSTVIQSDQQGIGLPLGSCYKGEFKATRNRFITWRVEGVVLELLEISLDYTLINNKIRIHFPSALVPSVAFYEKSGSDSSVSIAVSTTGKDLYRIIFPHPTSSFRKGFQQQPSIFSGYSNQQLELRSTKISNICRGTYINVINFANSRTILLGCANGSITTIIMSEPSFVQQSDNSIFEEYEIREREGSVMSRLWTGILPRRSESSDRAITGMSTHNFNGATYIFTYCYDNKIRVWSFEKQICVHTLDAHGERWSDTNLSNAVTKSSLQVYPVIAKPNHFKLIAFLCMKGESQFHIFNGSIEFDGSLLFELDKINYIDTDQIIDYRATPASIWVCYHHAGSYITKYAPLIKTENATLETNYWVPVHVEQPRDILSELLSSRDLVDQFIYKLFDQENYTESSISKSLSMLNGVRGYTKSPLRSEVETAIRNQIQVELSASLTSTDEEEVKLVTSQITISVLTRFFDYCKGFRKEENYAIGFLTPLSGSFVCLVKRGNLSFLRPCELIEALYAHPKLASSDSDLLEIMGAIKQIPTQLGTVPLTLFEEDLLNSVNPTESAYQQISWLVNGTALSDISTLSHEQLENARTFVSNFLKQLHRVHFVVDNIIYLLNLLDISFNSSEISDTLHPKANEWTEDLLASVVSEQLVAQTAKQFGRSRYEFTRDILLFISVLVRLRSQANITTSQLSELNSQVIPVVQDLLKNYFAIYWATSQRSTLSLLDSNLSQFSSMDISGNVSDVVPYLPGAPTVIELFYRGNIQTYQQKIASSPSITHMLLTPAFPFNLWDVLCYVIADVILSMKLPNNIINFASFLIKQSQFSTLKGLLNQVETKNAALYHLSGEANLHTGDASKARDNFLRASSMLDKEPDEVIQIIHNRISMLQNEDSPDFGNDLDFLVRYNLAVMQLFESKRIYEHIVEFGYATLSALSTLGTTNSHFEVVAPYVWSSIHKHSLEAGQFEQAYIAIASNPNHVSRVDCLRRFIVVLCQESKQKLITEFPFVGLVEEVQKLLEEKARLGDITKNPNYYQILYAYHIKHGNFRQAAIAMYEMSQRLATESHARELSNLQQQANSLSAAINALSLVNPKHRWIPTSAQLKIQPPSPKRKRNEDEQTSILMNVDPMITQSRFKFMEKSDEEKEKEALSIVELSDLEKQYLLALANIKLTQKNPQLRVSGLISPNDTVALLAEAGLFDLALSLSKSFGFDYKVVFEILTKKCLQLQLQIIPSSFTVDVARPGIKVNEKETSLWRTLEEYLKKYDNKDTNYAYHVTIAEKMLSTDTRMQLPNWLVISFKEKCPTSLLRVYMRYNLLEEASLLVLYQLSLATKSNDINPNTTCSKWFPYTLVDQLLRMIHAVTGGEHDDSMTGPQKDKLLSLSKEIHSAMNIYFASLEQTHSSGSTF